jgi:hypothetical protein
MVGDGSVIYKQVTPTGFEKPDRDAWLLSVNGLPLMGLRNRVGWGTLSLSAPSPTGFAREV